ncbi:hypothetical protein MLD38_040054 [Melastoma candidum]|uniref:Uncharacterized protein n=1 Tax=Melastoma candidum TaxID=119954 RepID=A0ACB9L4I5_9MYRT|nr:hypothetical protein MLD38_040054 [Melastoma candidum]
MAIPAGIAAAIAGLALLLSLGRASATPDLTIKHEDCPGSTYGGGTLYAASVAFILDDMMTTTSSFRNYDRTTQSGKYPTAYGHATCSTNLSPSDCATCLFAAKTLVGYHCGNKITAKMELQDCSLAYDKNPL